MSQLVFINDYASSDEHTINTFIKFKDFTEYYQYKHRPMQDIVDLMNSRQNQQLEEMILDRDIKKALESKSTQQIIEKALTKSIEEALKK